MGKNATSQDDMYTTISWWEGPRTPENHPLIVMLDFFYRLVRHREINEEKDIIELE